MREIKFTKENLQKHLAVCDACIVTGRDEIKGDIGEKVFLQGLSGVWKIDDIDECLNVHNYAEKYYFVEGFKNATLLENELIRIYGKDAQIYAHWIKKEI